MHDDPVFERGLPRFTELLDRHGIRATFFVNALDLKDPSKRSALARLAADGHEIANHGLDHAYLCGLPHAEKARHIAESSSLLEDFVGRPVRGFRAPGYSADGDVLNLLEARGYLYDSSAFPSSIGPLLRMSQWLRGGSRAVSYPSWQACFGSIRPYRPARTSLYRRGEAGILEVPVSVVPWLRLPLHFSYAAVLGGSYLDVGLRCALRAGSPVNFLFHLVDFADPLEGALFRFVPGLKTPLAERLALADRAMSLLARQTQPLPTATLCERLAVAP